MPVFFYMYPVSLLLQVSVLLGYRIAQNVTLLFTILIAAAENLKFDIIQKIFQISVIPMTYSLIVQCL